MQMSENENMGKSVREKYSLITIVLWDLYNLFSLDVLVVEYVFVKFLQNILN